MPPTEPPLEDESRPTAPGLLGYSDKLSVEPGETIRFMVSSGHATYESRLVRLVHGDTNPAGPGFRQVEIPSVIDGTRRGTQQAIRSGSYAELPVTALGSAFTFTVFVQSWAPGSGEQVVASQGAPYDGAGWAIVISGTGRAEFLLGTAGGAPERLPITEGFRRWQWYFLAVVLDTAASTLVVRRSSRGGLPGVTTVDPVVLDLPGCALEPDAPLLLAAVRGRDGRTSHHFDGKLDRPRLVGRALAHGELVAVEERPDDLAACAGILGAWDLGAEASTDLVRDLSENRSHGRLVNLPTRAVTGYNHSGRETCFRLVPEEYGAVHFHRDDLDDAGWAPDLELVVPDGLPSGVYAAWLRSGEDEEHLPFVVRPPRGAWRARVAVVMSTMTYLAYENFTDIGKDAWREGAFTGSALTHPYADAGVARDVYRYIDEQALFGPYDRHVDGSAVCYASMLRPILNMRPKFRYRTLDAPSRLAADLYLVDWLEHNEIAADYFTDHDLHERGAELFEPYAVVISSTHHEYWTGAMLDGLKGYLDGGGRFMYLGGNGLYGVVSVDPVRPHVVEIRRWGTSWPFECHPAERYHSTTGEPGGTWRNRGRPPNELVGIGTAGAGFDRGSPFGRMADATDPRVRFVFDGLGQDELIGDVPSLQLRWGAAGYEFDRCDAELGSPGTTLVLASSVRFNQSHRAMLDEQLWFVGGRDGKQVDDPQVPGRPHRFARSDMTYLEHRNGGAVFAAGAISWCSCLSAYGYENTVSRVTANVLHRFATTPKGTSPNDGPPDST